MGIPEDAVNAATLDTRMYDVLREGAEDYHHTEVRFTMLFIDGENLHDIELTDEDVGDMYYGQHTFRDFTALFE